MARKQITALVEELRSWLPNYDHGPDSFPTTFYRVLASLPGGEELEDMGYEPMGGIGWHEADLLGRVLEAIQGKHDVEDLVQGLIREEGEEAEEMREAPRTRQDARTKLFDAMDRYGADSQQAYAAVESAVSQKQKRELESARIARSKEEQRRTFPDRNEEVREDRTGRVDRDKIQRALAYVHHHERSSSSRGQQIGRAEAAKQAIRIEGLNDAEASILLNSLHVKSGEVREDRTEGVRIEHSARDKRWYVQWGGSGTGEPPRTKGFPTESAAKRFAAQVRRDIRMERTGYR